MPLRAFLRGLLRGLGLLALLAGAGCAGRPPAAPTPVVLSGLAFHSLPWEVKLAALPPGQRVLPLREALQQALDRLEGVISTWQPDSELMRLNRAPVGEWVPVSPPLLAAVETALAVSRLSGGAYDITVAPLVDLWGFGPVPAPAGRPAPEAIAAARARVGWQCLGVDAVQGRLRRERDLRLDLSSLGEGLGVDALAGVLEAAGAHDYLVAVAGTLRLRGQRPGGGPWGLAVEQPDGSGRPGRRLRLLGGAVSTSGSYRKFRLVEGRRYSHTLDPATGHPVTHAGLSVTVVQPAGTAAEADALATAFNVLGPERGLALAQERGLAVFYLVQTPQGLRERWSPAFAPYLAE